MDPDTRLLLHSFEHRVRFVDLCLRRDGRWQLRLSQVTPLGVT